MRNILTSFIIFQAVLSACALRKLPEFVEVCNRNDPQLFKCIKKSFENVLHHMGKGIPEMNLLPVDPIFLKTLDIKFGDNSTSLNMDAHLNDFKIFGTIDGTLEKGHFDIDKLIFDMVIKVPHIYLEADWKAKGKVLLIQFDSDGLYKANMTNVYMTSNYTGNRYTKKGEEYMKIDKFNLDIDIGSFNIHIDNLFKNNKELSENTNKVINENADLLFVEMKPFILEVIHKIIYENLNNVYSLFPLRVLYPN